MKMIYEKDFGTLFPIFRGIKGKRLGDLIIKLFAFDRVSRLYDNSKGYKGSEFAASVLKDLGVNYTIGNIENLNSLPEGAFITISNHPYGGLDGIILVDLIGGLRPDYKLIANKILSWVKTMKDNFITVNSPSMKEKNKTSNINGIRETLSRIQQGHPVGFFPSGKVSDFNLKQFRIKDPEWQLSILNLIKSLKAPILPIRFYDQNSPLFYFLGLINWRIRMIRMPHELFNKR